MQNQTDPIVDWVHKEYYKGKYNKEDIAKKLYSDRALFDEALTKIYFNTGYKDKYSNPQEFINDYYAKKGNPFEVKKKEPSQPSQEESSISSPEIQPIDQQTDQPVNPFQDTTPLSAQEQQIGATLDQVGNLLDQQPTADASIAGRVQQARDERGFGERLAEAGKYGLSKLVTMTSKIPEFIDEINYGGKLMENINKAGIERKLQAQVDAGKLTPEQLPEARQKAYDKNPYINNVLKEGMLDAIERNKLMESLGEFEKQYEEYAAETSQSITKSLSEGNFKEAGMQTAVSVVESLPITLAAAFGGPVGLAGIGMGTAAEKEQQLAEENPEMGDGTRVLNAVLTGLSEAGTELVTAGIGAKTIKAVVADQGEEAAKKVIAKTFKDKVGNTVRKIGGKTYVEEGLSEAANSFAQNVIDKYTGVDPDRNVMEGVNDAMIVGGASGKLFGLTQDVANLRNKAKSKRDNKAAEVAAVDAKEAEIAKLGNRRKVDAGVLDSSDALLDFMDQNGIEDVGEGFNQYVDALPDDAKKEALKNEQDILRIAKTKKDGRIQDTTQAEQDEAQPEATTEEGQTKEEVQGEPVIEDDASQQPTQPEPDVSNTEPNVEPEVVDDGLDAGEPNPETSLPENDPDYVEPLTEGQQKTKDLVEELAEGDPINQEMGKMVTKLGAINNVESTESNRLGVSKDGGLPKGGQKLGRVEQKMTRLRMKMKLTVGSKAIELNAKKRGKDPKQLKRQVATHELTHAVTLQAIEASREVKNMLMSHMSLPNWKGREWSYQQIAERINMRTGGQPVTAEDVQAIETLDSNIKGLMREVDKALKSGEISLARNDQYGMTDSMEFIAEAFSNPQFMEALNNIKDSRGQSIKDKVIKAITDFIEKFGGKEFLKAIGAKKGSVLESAIQEGFRAMDFYAKLNAQEVQTNKVDGGEVIETSLINLTGNKEERRKERQFAKEERRKERQFAKEERRKERQFAKEEKAGIDQRPLHERFKDAVDEIEQRRSKKQPKQKDAPKKKEPKQDAYEFVRDQYNDSSYKGKVINDLRKNGTPEQKAFINAFVKLGADQNTSIDSGATEGVALGQTHILPHEFDPMANVVINDKLIDDSSRKAGLDPDTVRRYVQTHELVHAIAVNVMDSNKAIYPLQRGGYSNDQVANELNKKHGSSLTGKDVGAISEINKAFKEYLAIAKDNPQLFREGLNIDYGLTNVDEFVAELFSNPDFRKALDKIKYKDTSLLDKIIKAISNFVNKIIGKDLLSQLPSSSGSLLEAAIKDGMKIMDVYSKMNQHKIDAVNKIRSSEALTKEEKDRMTTFYLELSDQEPASHDQARNYIEKNKDNLSDSQIAANIADAFDLTDQEAVDLIEEVTGRDFVPDLDTIMRIAQTQKISAGRKIMTWVKYTFGGNKLKKGQTIDDAIRAQYMSDFDELIRLNLQDKWIGLKRYQEAIEKNIGVEILDELDAYTKREQASSVTNEYENDLMKAFFGKARGEIGSKKSRDNSYVGMMNSEGVTWKQVNDFLKFLHAPAFNDRINDIRAKKYQKAIDRVVDLTKQRDAIDQNESPDAYKHYTEEIKKANKVAEKNKPLTNPPSGISNADANQKIADMRAENPRIEVWAMKLRSELFNAYMENLREYGLVPFQTKKDGKPLRGDHLENGTSEQSDVVFENYVPLRVKDENFQTEWQQSMPGMGNIYNFGVYGLEGHQKSFDIEDRYNPLNVMLNMAVTTKRVGEINNSMRAFGNLLRKYPVNDMKVVDGTVVVSTDPLGNVVPNDVSDYSGEVKNAKAKIAYINEDGKYSYIIFRSDTHPIYLGLTHFPKRYSRLGESLTKRVHQVNSLRRNLITQWNIVFGFRNIQRDIQEATFNSLSTDQLKNAKRRFLANLIHAHQFMNFDRYFGMTGGGTPLSKGVNTLATGQYKKKYLNLNDPKIKTFHDAWLNMQQAGGSMSWGRYGMDFMEEMAEIQERVNIIEEGLTGTQKSRDAATRLGNYFGMINDGMENATRLAAYVTAREMGASEQAAAAVSRDITLNFQRKGLWAGQNFWLGYLFLNAGIQGVERGSRAVRKFGLGKSIVALSVGGFIARALVHGMMNLEDDEAKQEFENLIMDPYTRAQKTILPIPAVFGKPVTVSKPYSLLRAFTGFGESAADMVFGYKTPVDVLTDLQTDLLTVFDPIGGFSGDASNVIPFLPLRLYTQVGADQSWNGTKILYHKADENIPSYQKYTKSTDPSYVAAAQMLYDEIGLDLYSPAYMEYIVDQTVNIGLIKDGIGMLDEFSRVAMDKRVSEKFDEFMMRSAGLRTEKGKSDYTKSTGRGTSPYEVESKPFQLRRGVPIMKAFYRPTDTERAIVSNFFTIMYKGVTLSKTPLGGISDKEMEYLKKGYELIKREDLVSPSTLTRNMNNLVENFPDEDWSWYIRGKRKRR